MEDSRDPRRDAPSGSGHVLPFRKLGSVRGPSDPGADDGADPTGQGSEPSASDLFTILWHALADILGTAAAATLLRRAAQRALPRWPELAALCIAREGLEYRYTVPAAWKDLAVEPPHALCELARELWTLLVDLTGPVVVNRLAQIPELRDRGIVPRSKESS